MPNNVIFFVRERVGFPTGGTIVAKNIWFLGGAGVLRILAGEPLSTCSWLSTIDHFVNSRPRNRVISSFDEVPEVKQVQKEKRESAGKCGPGG